MARKAKTKVKKRTVKKKPSRSVKGYLIIECDHGDMYAYVEPPAHHKKMMQYRIPELQRPISALDNECDLSTYGNNFYFIQELY